METILWTCVEAQKLITNAINSPIPNEVRVELVQIFKEGSPRTCKFLDAKAD